MEEIKQQDTALVAVKSESSAIMQWAQTVTVATQVEATTAIVQLAKVKALKARVVAYWEPMKTAAYTSWKKITASEKSMTDVCDESERIVKGKVLAWQQEEDRRAEELRRKLQAEADEKARKERDRQEALARAQREKEEAARRAEAEARQRAAQEQDAEKRKLAMAEAERQRKAADAAAAAAAQREETAAMVEAPVVTIQAQAVEGAGVRLAWKAELVDKFTLIKSAAGDFEGTAASLLTFDQKAADGLARATKGKVAIPGIKFIEVKSMAMDRASK